MVRTTLLRGIALLLLALTALACGDAAPPGDGCPATLGGAALESCLRAALGIPTDAPRVALLQQSSHLDWDWLLTFEDYYQRSVDQIFTDVLDILQVPGGTAGAAGYSVAEVAYVARFVDAHPDAAAQLRAAGRRFRVLGGGITSPDNLLPEGEAFVRNFLVGRRFTAAQGLITTPQAWLPDDFGHDAQLPIVLRAMGLDAVGFARVPGVDSLLESLRIDPPAAGSLGDQLLHDGVDFVWRASDGSAVQAHWLARGYGPEGDGIDVPPRGAGDVPEAETAKARLHAILDLMLPASHTPYVFVPIGGDFARPKMNLAADVAAWNASEYATTGVFAVDASFDDYVRLVGAHAAELPVRRFDPTPYWTGHIATRPELKTLHVAATRTLLAAETFGVIADGALRADAAAFTARSRARQAALHDAWDLLVPSTHHDFVNGTSADPVYQGEQLPLLQEALARSAVERDRALDEIAAAVPGSTGADGARVVVANALGFARSGLVAANLVAAGPGVQRGADGTALFLAAAPSLGYVTATPGHDAAGDVLVPSLPATVETTSDGAIVLANAALRAEIRRDAAWGVVSLVDRASGAEVLAAGGVANDLVVYADQGGLYRFGDEMPGCSLAASMLPASMAATDADAEVLESGPLRVVVRTHVKYAGADYERVYTLIADEPLLRVTATGSAPDGASVMVHVPLAGPVDELVHGTPAHWDVKQPERAPYGLTFEAVHDFAIARDQGVARMVVDRAGVSAWAAQRAGLLVGVLWRNASFEQCDVYGPRGHDPDAHTVSWALRVPSGLGLPESGAPLRESLAVANPLLARAARGDGALPPNLSLASVDPGQALLTAAKRAEDGDAALVLRVYRPDDASGPLELTTHASALVPAGVTLRPRLVTALESPADAAAVRAADVQGDASHFSLTATGALTTVELAASDASAPRDAASSADEGAPPDARATDRAADRR
jgi:alpha-mannosidase